MSRISRSCSPSTPDDDGVRSRRDGVDLVALALERPDERDADALVVLGEQDQRHGPDGTRDARMDRDHAPDRVNPRPRVGQGPANSISDLPNLCLVPPARSPAPGTLDSNASTLDRTEPHLMHRDSAPFEPLHLVRDIGTRAVIASASPVSA